MNENADFRELELKAIYKNENQLIFCWKTFIEVIYRFKLLSVSNQFKESLFNNPEHKGKLDSMPKEKKKVFTECQNKISTFLSYKVGDLLFRNGYVLPKDPVNPEIIYVDINKITNSKNKTTAFNDIDVLAIDTKAKLIFNIELKFFKVAISNKDFQFDKIENEIYENIAKRHGKIEESKKDTLDILFNIKENYDDYAVKSIIVTARPNKGGIINRCVERKIESGSEEKIISIPYYAYNEFVDIANNRELNKL